MMAKGHAVPAFITRTAPELILKEMKLMDYYGYARENSYEKYYRDSAILKLFLGGVHYAYFTTCWQF